MGGKAKEQLLTEFDELRQRIAEFMAILTTRGPQASDSHRKNELEG